MSKPGDPPRSKFLKWFFIVITPVFVVVVIWASSVKGNAPALTFATDAATAKNLSGGFEEVPHIGSQELLKPPHLRYCLAERIRVDAAAGQADRSNPEHARRLSQMAADHEARCASFKYKIKGGRSDLEQAQAQVDSRRAALEAAGRSRFK